MSARERSRGRRAVAASSGGRWVVVTLAAAVLGLAGLRAWRGSTPPAEPARASEAVPTALSYARDRSGLYDVAWHTTSTFELPQTGPVQTAVDFEGRVEIADAGKDGARRLLVVRVDGARHVSARAFGDELLKDGSGDLVGREAVLAIGAGGAVEEVLVATDVPPLEKNLLQALALHFAVTMPGADAGPYVATEEGDHGPVVWRYTTEDGMLRKVAVSREVRGEGRVEFSGGAPQHITVSATTTSGQGERIQASATASFAATRVAAEGGPSPRAVDRSRFEAHPPNEHPAALDERNANLTLAAGMTVEDMNALVGAYSMGKTPPKGTVMRSAALLRAKPELCDDLERTFHDTNEAGRELVIDLLASSGDVKAQTTMRALLATEAARSDRSLYERLIQRFSLVALPVAESIAFVTDEWKRARAAGERRMVQATAYTLGALAGHAYSAHDEALAEPVLDLLLRRITDKPDADEERGLVAALGNAGMPRGLSALVDRANAKDARTRAQVATSLRKYVTPDVRVMLVDMLGDTDAQVALSAVRSLDIQPFAESDRVRIAERMEGSRIHPDAYASLVGVIQSHAGGSPSAVRALRAMRARAEGRAELASEIDQAILALNGDAGASL